MRNDLDSKECQFCPADKWLYFSRHRTRKVCHGYEDRPWSVLNIEGLVISINRLGVRPIQGRGGGYGLSIIGNISDSTYLVIEFYNKIR
jgi:hypothetical protein